MGVELDMTRGFFVYLTTKTRALTVTGVWGWHDDYARAWKPSGDVIPAGGVNASVTTFTAASAAQTAGTWRRASSRANCSGSIRST